MSLEQLSYLAQIVGSVGLIFSLVFVGLQIKHNTAALQRNEHNSTMAQWTVIRQAIATNRDIAELMYFSEGAFEATGGALLGTLLRTPGGESWWRKAKHIGFPPGFVLDVDAVLAKAYHHATQPTQHFVISSLSMCALIFKVLGG